MTFSYPATHFMNHQQAPSEASVKSRETMTLIRRKLLNHAFEQVIDGRWAVLGACPVGPSCHSKMYDTLDTLSPMLVAWNTLMTLEEREDLRELLKSLSQRLKNLSKRGLNANEAFLCRAVASLVDEAIAP